MASLRLGKKLWKLIEGPEGYAFIADDIIDLDDKEVIRIAENRLDHFKDCVSKLSAFIKKNKCKVDKSAT